MADYVVQLPPINGRFEAGLAVGIDPTLPNEDKLPILWPQDITGNRTVESFDLRRAVGYAMGWVFNRHGNSQYAATYAAAAQIIIRANITRIFESGELNIYDGDWTLLLEADRAIVPCTAAFLNLVTPAELSRALTIIVATKINLWTMNHHTGQGQMAGYAAKVCRAKFNTDISDAMITMAHTIGHWASTLAVWEVAEVRFLRHSTVALPETEVTIGLSDDAKLRFTGMPAGSHRLGVAYEAALRLSRTTTGRFCPGVVSFRGLPEARAVVLERPVAYHMGAGYFTGQARLPLPLGAEGFLGRLGNFVLTMLPHSTLVSSPHFQKSRVQSYSDYDAEWDSLLIKYKLTSATTASTALNNLMNAATGASDQDWNDLQQGFRLAPEA